jgi:hypothetical protein
MLSVRSRYTGFAANADLLVLKKHWQLASAYRPFTNYPMYSNVMGNDTLLSDAAVDA